MSEHHHTATEIVNFASDACERPDCATCGDPACSHGIYELRSNQHITGFRYHCATVIENGKLCDCEGYEPVMSAEDAAVLNEAKP